jgi:hypothetical protein
VDYQRYSSKFKEAILNKISQCDLSVRKFAELTSRPCKLAKAIQQIRLKSIKSEFVIVSGQTKRNFRLFSKHPHYLRLIRLHGGTIGEHKRPTSIRPEPLNKLSTKERQAVIDAGNSNESSSLPPSHIVPILADISEYLASELSFYLKLKRKVCYTVEVRQNLGIAIPDRPVILLKKTNGVSS